MPTTIHLTWPANPASELVTKYKVVQQVGGAGPFLFLAETPNNFYDIVNPSANVFAWQVRAINFVGEGPPSPVTTGPAVPTAPPAPTVTVTT